MARAGRPERHERAEVFLLTMKIRPSRRLSLSILSFEAL